MRMHAAALAVAVAAALGQITTCRFAIPAQQLPFPPHGTVFRKLLLWNASASAPRGLCLLRPARPLYIGELVSVSPPAALAGFSATRGYLPLGVPLLKHIAALTGQPVCRSACTVMIDGRAVAVTHERDSHSRPVPSWRGCRLLRNGDVLLLNATADSFDGRYFGVLSTDTITARAETFWTISEH